MRQLLVCMVAAVAGIAVLTAPAEACKKRVRVSRCCGPVVAPPLVLSRGCCSGPVVAVPVVVLPPVVVVRDGCCDKPVVVVKPKRKVKIKVTVEVSRRCNGTGVNISTPIGRFSFGR